MIGSVDAALAAQIKHYWFDPTQGAFDSANSWQPIAVVDLDACPRDANIDVVPPLPVVGVGNREHPLAAKLDAVIEPPITAGQLIREVEKSPHTAAVTVQLLRVLEGMPLEAALTAESFAYGLLQGSAEHASWLAKTRESLQPSPPGTVRIERRNSLLSVVIDRPAASNAIDRHMRDLLHEAFDLAAHDPTITAVRLRAVGKAFCVGADLTEFGTTLDPATAHLIRARTLPALALARRAGIVDVHVQGACVGAGLEIAAFAARVSAAPNAWFQLPELTMGLLAGAGGCVSVSRRIGRQRAALMMLSGRRIDARTALRWRLIDAIEDQLPIDDGGAHVS
jgi:enoyl-CoA hydratase